MHARLEVFPDEVAQHPPLGDWENVEKEPMLKAM